MTSGAASPRSAQRAWLFVGLLSALPWLLPTHTLPWPTFYLEWAAGMAALAAAVLALVSMRHPVALPGWVAGAALLALLPWLQSAAGLFVFPAEAALSSAYIAATAALAVVAAHAERTRPGLLIATTFGSLVAAAIVSTVLAVHQWLRLDMLGFWAAPPGPAMRPVANVGHPNNLATLLVWGLCGLWWFHEAGRLGGRLLVALAVPMLAGVVLTQSRTGWLQVAVLAVAVLVAAVRWGGADRRRIGAVAALLAGFAAAVYALAPLTQSLNLSPSRSASDQMAVGKRPAIWAMSVDAVAQRPWLGWGANQSLTAHAELASTHPSIQVPVQHAHNIVLDLAVWFGAPVAGLVVLAGAIWARRRLAKADRQQWVVVAALAVLLVHALLELPHAYLFFLVPLAVMFGTLDPVSAEPGRLRLPALAAAAALLPFATILLFAMRDYGAIEEDVARHARYEAGIGVQPPPKQDKAVLLRPLQRAYEELRRDPYRSASSEDLARQRQVVTRYPLAGPLFAYAKTAAANGRPDESRWALELLCNTQPSTVCLEVREKWAIASETRPLLAAVSFPVDVDADPPR